MNQSDIVEIVVVEDDPNDAELIMRVLRKRNLTNKLVHLQDGEQALDFIMGHANEHHPKVVLLDIKLPKVDGIEVLRQMKANDKTKDIPVVILTSSKEEKDVVAAYALGVNSYVTKPIKFDDFAKAVSEMGMYWMLLNKALEE
ncbi:MAG: response regulator [Methanomassiliicoccales archaeon]|jgi:two-component system response regulator